MLRILFASSCWYLLIPLLIVLPLVFASTDRSVSAGKPAGRIPTQLVNQQRDANQEQRHIFEDVQRLPDPLEGAGWAVDVDGDTAVVGSWRAGGAQRLEAAYIFVRHDTEWIMQQTLTASDGMNGDNFGVSVAIHRDTIVVGASDADIFSDTDLRSTLNQGAAYVFTRTGNICRTFA